MLVSMDHKCSLQLSASERLPGSAGASPASLLTRVLFRIFDALCCGAILLDSRKVPIHLNERARKCFRATLSVSRGPLCATDRSSHVLFQTVLDRMLKYGQSHRDWRREAVALQRSDGTAMICRVIPVEEEARGGLDGAALVVAR